MRLGSKIISFIVYQTFYAFPFFLSFILPSAFEVQGTVLNAEEALMKPLYTEEVFFLLQLFHTVPSTIVPFLLPPLIRDPWEMVPSMIDDPRGGSLGVRADLKVNVSPILLAPRVTSNCAILVLVFADKNIFSIQTHN